MAAHEFDDVALFKRKLYLLNISVIAQVRPSVEERPIEVNVWFNVRVYVWLI